MLGDTLEEGVNRRFACEELDEMVEFCLVWKIGRTKIRRTLRATKTVSSSFVTWEGNKEAKDRRCL